jgi:hypothetical protein
MANKIYHRAYGFKLYLQVVRFGFVDPALVKRQSGFGPGKFMDGSSLMPESNEVVAVGEGADYKIFSGSAKTIKKAAVASNVATLTFDAAHGITASSTVLVRDLPAPFAALNGTRVVTAVTTSAPFTLSFAFQAANIAEATVSAGTAMAGVLKLDGTDPPVRLQGLRNCSPNEGGNTESIIDYDTDAKGYSSDITTSKSQSFTVAGQTNYRDPAYWLMRYAAKDAVDQDLMLKFCRTGPTSYNHSAYGYGMVPSVEEPSEAASVINYNMNIACFGPYEIEK